MFVKYSLVCMEMHIVVDLAILENFLLGLVQSTMRLKRKTTELQQENFDNGKIDDNVRFHAHQGVLDGQIESFVTFFADITKFSFKSLFES